MQRSHDALTERCSVKRPNQIHPPEILYRPFQTQDDIWQSIGFDNEFSLLGFETPTKRARTDDRLSRSVDRFGAKIDSMEERLSKLERENEFAKSLLDNLMNDDDSETSNSPLYDDILNHVRHYCNYCDLSFPQSKYLCTHMMERHVTSTKKLFYCSKCKNSFAELNKFESHLKEHCRSDPCSLCQNGSNGHVKHPLENFVRLKLICDFCPCTDSNISSFQIHCLTCINNPSNENYRPTGEGRVCPTCSQVFNSNAYLLKHISQKHKGGDSEQSNGEISKFVCDDCGKRFVSGASLGGHKKIHRKKPGLLTKFDKMMRPEERVDLVDRYMERAKPDREEIAISNGKNSSSRVEPANNELVEDMPDFF